MMNDEGRQGMIDLIRRLTPTRIAATRIAPTRIAATRITSPLPFPLQFIILHSSFIIALTAPD